MKMTEPVQLLKHSLENKGGSLKPVRQYTLHPSNTSEDYEILKAYLIDYGNRTISIRMYVKFIDAEALEDGVEMVLPNQTSNIEVPIQSVNAVVETCLEVCHVFISKVDDGLSFELTFPSSEHTIEVGNSYYIYFTMSVPDINWTEFGATEGIETPTEDNPTP